VLYVETTIRVGLEDVWRATREPARHVRWDRVLRGSAAAVPFLAAGARRHILFPETGAGVPFTIENYAYTDAYGRETLTFVRTFQVRPHRRRRFDATMVYRPGRGIVDFLGTHQHVAVVLRPSVDASGGLWIRSGGYRCAGRRFPAALAGDVRLHEWWDEAGGCFRIEVRVSNRVLGPVFGYRGRFTTRQVDTGAAPVPEAVKPLRDNARS
jgi:hypothetical protein